MHTSRPKPSDSRKLLDLLALHCDEIPSMLRRKQVCLVQSCGYWDSNEHDAGSGGSLRVDGRVYGGRLT